MNISIELSKEKSNKLKLLSEKRDYLSIINKMISDHEGDNEINKIMKKKYLLDSKFIRESFDGFFTDISTHHSIKLPKNFKWNLDFDSHNLTISDVTDCKEPNK